MTTTTTQVPITTIIPILAAIGDRSWQKFKDLEADFVSQHGIQVWQDVFNFQVKPALDRESDRWLLVQWCGEGINWIKDVT
jgi:hypothetical protein